jgi:hypothetical protein
MSDDKPKPVDDLKEGLNLLFRAAKGAVEHLPTQKIEDVAKDAVKEVGRAFESLGSELDKAFGRSGPGATGAPPDGTTGSPPAPPPGATPGAPPAEAKADDPPKPEAKYDDGYAPEPPANPRGPRIG